MSLLLKAISSKPRSMDAVSVFAFMWNQLFFIIFLLLVYILPLSLLSATLGARVYMGQKEKAILILPIAVYDLLDTFFVIFVIYSTNSSVN